MLWAGILSFLIIMAYWSINYIALELEMPFGDDYNDLPCQDLQKDMNVTLIELMDPRAICPPKFVFVKEVHRQLIRKQMDMDVFLGDQMTDASGLQQNADPIMKDPGLFRMKEFHTYAEAEPVYQKGDHKRSR